MTRYRIHTLTSAMIVVALLGAGVAPAAATHGDGTAVEKACLEAASDAKARRACESAGRKARQREYNEHLAAWLQSHDTITAEYRSKIADIKDAEARLQASYTQKLAVARTAAEKNKATAAYSNARALLAAERQRIVAKRKADLANLGPRPVLGR